MLPKKYSMLISCFIVFILIMTGCSSNSKKAGSKANEKITLKLATWTPAESFYTKQLFEPFMKKVTSLTDGRVQFKFYPAEQLGKGADSLSLVSAGVADISLFSPDYTPDEMPIGSALVGMPGLFETPIQGATAYAKVAQQSPMFETDFLNNDVRPVLLSVTPIYEIFSNKKEIKVPEDLKGFKIRSSGGVATEALNYAKATPVTISSSDIYSAFSTGIVDGLHYNYESVESFGLGEVTKYATRGAKFGVGKMGLIINEKVYQGLPQDIQKAILQAGEEIGKSFAQYTTNADEKVYEDWKKFGKINVYDISDDEKKKWQNFDRDFQQYWLKKQNSKDFEKVLEMFKEEVKKVK